MERRRQDRRPVDAEVRLFPKGRPELEFPGQLLDYSDRGFRAVHGQMLLSTGQDVQFRHFRAEGTARVVWNRICAGQVESGFLIVE